MRAALGLVTPNAGRALVDGVPFVKTPSPMTAVGSVLDAKSAHKGRSAYTHLRGLAFTNGIPRSRVDESSNSSVVVERGKAQCRSILAGQGRAVLLSSHLMSEVALTADDLVIIGRGRILETTTVAAFVAEHSAHSIRVASESDKLHAVFETAPQVTVREVPRNANDPQQGRVFRIEGAAIGADCAGVSRRRSTRPARYRAGAGPIRRACRNLHSAEHAGGAAMTQPHIPSQPQPVAAASAGSPISDRERLPADGRSSATRSRRWLPTSGGFH